MALGDIGVPNGSVSSSSDGSGSKRDRLSIESPIEFEDLLMRIEGYVEVHRNVPALPMTPEGVRLPT